MTVETEKGRILASVLTENQELQGRIRALESACEAAVKAFKKADYGVDIFALAPNVKRAVEQLEEAIKHG